ncbi:unnamed protein product [Orchesella dallaii]|uniref:L-seryl-tRNA(Sec) kinase n=1 Tax=Orchesella dallaii TaxID=48710 RepID=A0ABP1R303_9HEXA
MEPPTSKSANQDLDSKLSLVVLMGLPASGKSTLANKLVQFFCNWQIVVISFDEFVPLNIQAQISQQQAELAATQIDDQANRKVSSAKILRKKFVSCVDAVVGLAKNRKYLKAESIEVTNCLQSLETSLSSFGNVDVISDQVLVSKTSEVISKLCSDVNPKLETIVLVDDNNYYQSMRNDFYQVAKVSEVGFCIIHCKASLKICVQRNFERQKACQIPQKAIVEMSMKFEDSNPMQNAFDMYCVEIDSGANIIDEQLKVLEQIFESSFTNRLKQNEDRTEEIERERRICSENEVHQADLMLRKWISKRMNLAAVSGMVKAKTSGNSSCNSRADKKNLSKDLNSRKKIALDKLRSGEFKVTFEVHQDVEFRNEVIQLFENLILE